MRSIALSTLRKFWENSPSYADSIEPGMAWYRETLKADWSTLNEVKAQFSNASVLRDGTWVATLKAPPVDGKANTELVGLVAQKFRCRKTAVSIKAGASGRTKLVMVEESS